MVNQLVVHVNLESSPEDRSQLFAIFTLRLFSFLLIRYVISIVSRYYPDLWLYVRFDFLGSHIVYLVLSLKPGATKWYQSNADCRTQA